VKPPSKVLWISDRRGKCDALQVAFGILREALNDRKEMRAAIVPKEHMRFVDDNGLNARDKGATLIGSKTKATLQWIPA